MQIINKMSAKAVAGKIPNMVLERDEDGKPTQFSEDVILAKIIGIASDTVTGKTQYGDFVGFVGQFKGTNVADGEIFISSKLFLPDLVTSMVASALKDSDGSGVEIAIAVGVRGANNAFGYEYIVKPLIEPKQSDSISQIESRIAALEDKSEPKHKK
jgi:hypothetical protein